MDGVLVTFDASAQPATASGLACFGAEELATLRPDFVAASFAESRARRCMLARSGNNEVEAQNELVFVCEDGVDLTRQLWFEPIIEKLAPARLVRAIASADDLERLFATAEEGLRAMDAIAIEASPGPGSGKSDALVLSMASIESTENATVRLVDSTLYDAPKLGASDIHLEVQHRALQIKYRLDGVLQAIRRIESIETAQQVISRIKVLADLDIAERRVPQDGRFRVILDQREIDFRVSIMPNVSDEDAVLRVLDRKHLTGQFQTLTLDSLGFETEVKSFVRRSARMPYGLLLVTGPTGSGKTTTLYAAISEINTGLDKIVTIEDPIEYQLPSVLQIPVNEKKGLTFAKGLRSILRHDPDKIMVGEIRDSETAQIAVQAALTGHQVFTTVHANNVFDVIGRFSNMGVDNYSLVAALTGIMAQRLVRKLCSECARPVDEVPGSPNRRLMKANGCAACRGTGYRGRIAIAETLAIDDDMKDLLVQHAPISTVKRHARERGFRSLRDSAQALAALGATSHDEIERVAPGE
jgi:general secretion pathway protein E